jgi:thiamine biosynthesis lipoprotein
LWSVSRGTRNNEFAVLLAITALLCAGCVTPPQAELHRYEFSQPQMGVPFRIVLYTTNQAHAETAAKAAFDRIRELNDKLSDYDLDSELSKLSRASGQGRTVPVGEDLWKVLTAAQNWARLSDGAFDVTVGPVVNLWRHARRQQQLPRADRLSEAKARVGYTNLVLDPKNQTALLLVPEMRLDLGGIAKGFAADEALKILRRQGIRSALVAAAGDIALGEAPPGEHGWKVTLASLDVTNAPPPKVLTLASCGVATSGDLFQRLEIDGVRYSHIVNPRTGIGLTDHSLVSIIAPDCMAADALATALSVLGPEKGLRLVKATPGTGMRLLRTPNQNKIEVVEYPSKRFNAAERSGDDRSVSSGDTPKPAVP